MSLTGVFLLPIPPGQPSPSSTLISHISRAFPADPLPTYSLDHRLFVDTSSLLPNADASLRRSTSILTLSHTPSKTYVGTISPRDKSQTAEQPVAPPSLIAIPSTYADSFTQLIGTKLQPHWAHRQSLVVENGTALSLQDGKWVIRIGDLKTPSRSNQGATSLRGMLIEVSYMDGGVASKKDHEAAQETNKQDVKMDPIDKEHETLLRGFLESVTDVSEIPLIHSLESTRALFRRTQVNGTGKDNNAGGAVASTVDWSLAGLYIDILRGSRS